MQYLWRGLERYQSVVSCAGPIFIIFPRSLLHTGCWVRCAFQRLLLCKSGSEKVKHHFVGSMCDLRNTEQRSVQHDAFPCSQLNVISSLKTSLLRGCIQSLLFNSPSGCCNFIPPGQASDPGLLLCCSLSVHFQSKLQGWTELRLPFGYRGAERANPKPLNRKHQPPRTQTSSAAAALTL